MACDQDQDERTARFQNATILHLKDVYQLARFLTRNEADAHDAVQECYLRAFRSFDRYRGSAVKPWLLAIVRNVCYSEFARRRRREEPVDLIEHEPACDDLLWQAPQQDPETEIIVRQKHAAIRELVSALPPLFREAIVLREFSAMSYRDIAEALDVPIGTVMSRLARARALLLAGWTAMDGTAKHRTEATNEETVFV